MKYCKGIIFFGSLALCSLICTDAIAVLSVDLGSEWMKIAFVKPGVPMEVVLNKESKRKTEVAVSFCDGERHFGSSAMSKGVRLPKTTYLYLQDLLAKRIDNPTVQQYQKRFPYHKIKEDPETGTIVFVNEATDAVYSPEELMAMVLNHSRSLAEDYAQQPIDTCVITVPAYFNQAERKAMMYSAELAGLKVSQLMDDNTAAALNYGVFRRHDINTSATYMLFYDMGATSTIASVIAYQVVKVNGIADPQLSVKGVGFDRTLGGLEMEFRLRDLLIKRFNENKKTSSDVTSSPRAMAKLLKEAKRLMKVLSANTDHTAQIEGLIDDEDFKTKVTREEFQEVCADLWQRVAAPMEEALKAAELTMDTINQIILVGGATRIPKVQETLLKSSGKSELGKSINADEAPALGASYQAAAVSNAFRVKTFHVKSAAVYPIEIDFDRYTKQDDGEMVTKHVKRTLFQRSNPYPQKKVITFNRFYDNFNFSVKYGDVEFLSETEQKVFGSLQLSEIEVKGVADVHNKHGNDENSESKGVKAHFRMDESGLLKLQSVESVYEVNKTVTENATGDEEVEESTLQKIQDRLSSLFGGGNEDNSTETADDKKKDSDKEQSDETKSKDGDGKTATDETSKPEENVAQKEVNETKTVTKSVKVKEAYPLEPNVTSLDRNTPTEEHRTQSITKLKVLADKDARKLARETAMNKLETYIYDKRDKLDQEEYEDAMTVEEKEKIPTALNEASDWMDELEGEPEAEVYNEKRKALKDISRAWLTRVKLRRDAVPALQDLEELFNYTKHFERAIHSLGEDLQIYTPVEVKTLSDLLTSTIEWKNDTVKKESELKLYEDPVLKPEDIKQKIYSLNREVQYLLNKAKTAKPLKPKVEKKKNETSAEKEQTIETNTTTTEEPTQPPPPTDDASATPTTEQAQEAAPETESPTPDDATASPEEAPLASEETTTEKTAEDEPKEEL